MNNQNHLAIFSTARLYARQLDESDFAQFCRLMTDTRIETFGTVSYTEQSARKVFEGYAEHYREGKYGGWLVIDRATDEMVGTCTLRPFRDLESCGCVVNLGFRVFPEYWRLGFATEIGHGMLNYGFALGLDEIVAATHPEYQASLRVIQKLGMEFWKDATYQGTPARVFRANRRTWPVRYSSSLRQIS